MDSRANSRGQKGRQQGQQGGQGQSRHGQQGNQSQAGQGQQQQSGQSKGQPNRRTREVNERLEQIGCDPIEGMARLAMDETTPRELRGRMYAELAAYLYPKRKAVEIQQDFAVKKAEELSDEELEYIIRRHAVESHPENA